MKSETPLARWREIVYPLFWPVFFWNLRRFARFLRMRIEANDGQGLITYDITWWGAIRIHRLIDPDPELWDAPLQGCAQRVHIATLDVLNPHLSPYMQIPAQAGIHGLLSPPVRLAAEPILGYLPSQVSAGALAWSGLSAGTFPEPAFLNTS